MAVEEVVDIENGVRNMQMKVNTVPAMKSPNIQWDAMRAMSRASVTPPGKATNDLLLELQMGTQEGIIGSDLLVAPANSSLNRISTGLNAYIFVGVEQ